MATLVPAFKGAVCEDGGLTRKKLESKMSWLSTGTRADFFDVKATVEEGQLVIEKMEAGLAAIGAK
eukprot:9213116-Prorocentrum_lima.AAC.1